MYFRFGTRESDPHFSWIIVKNPASMFERELSRSGNGGKRKVLARFINGGAQTYEGHVENDLLAFLEHMRDLNMGNYVHTQLHAVCPFNLKGFDIVFRSSLRGENGTKGELSDAEFLAAKLFTAVIGPYPCPREHLVAVFDSVGIAAEVLNDRTKSAFMAKLENREPQSTTEFLQKIYLLSFYLTLDFLLERYVKEEQIEKFIEMCKSWLNTSSYRDKVIAKLCGRNPEMMERFEEGLAEAKNGEDEEVEADKVETQVRKQGLHQKRHQLIIENKPTGAAVIIDLGCSEGKLLRRLAEISPDAKIIGVDADESRVKRARRKNQSPNTTILHSNILYPRLPDEALRPDFLVLTEVIEHLPRRDRQAMIEMIVNGICPRTFILTTPNFEYNPRYGLVPGEYRHGDHKIEFSREQFEEEITRPISEKYEVIELKVLPEEDLQPTFCILCRQKAEVEVNLRIMARVREMYQPLYLEVTDYAVSEKEMRYGLTTYGFLANANNIFYLAPTVAPVDFDSRFPKYLEYPQSCFDYYRERGIRRLVGEEKYMGSRAHILVFRDIQQARLFGFDFPIVIISRSGLPFMNDKAKLLAIHAEIEKNLGDWDFIVLDAEVMPWSFKAGPWFMDKNFRLPGETAFLARSYGHYGSLENAVDFLRVLEHFAADAELEIRPFHMLARGKVKTRRGQGEFRNIQIGFHMPHREHLTIIESLAAGNAIIKPCVWHEVDVEDKASMANSIDLWHYFCEQNDGEGFVYKPADFLVYGRDGYLRQPAMKVRGREYLRIIYGIDYLEPEWFAKVSKRGTRKKRVLAIQEQELAMRILRAFLNQRENEKRRFTAAFLGMDDVNMRSIDRTL
ncbi:methyltransferase domain-containing protein [Candidatus Falkowbacteria bacterium]|nr:methyltransferase domain-containing protein [Candidatus Falkowbacteria bacterium]